MNKSLLTASCTTLLISFIFTPLSAQIELEATYTGRPAGNLLGLTVSNLTTKCDFTNDGIPEIFLMKSDPQGSTSLAIVNAADYTVWRFIPELGDEVVLTFAEATVIGCSELDGNKTFTDIILAEKKGRRFINPIVIDVDGVILWDGTSKTLLGIAQMDADVCEEIIASDPILQQIEIHGKKDTTNTNVQFQRR